MAQEDLDVERDIGPSVGAQRLVANGKVVWAGDSRLAGRLRERIPEAHGLLELVNGRPALRSPERFARAVADARFEAAADADAAWRCAEETPATKRAAAQEADARGRVQLWKPNGRIAHLRAVVPTAAREDPSVGAFSGDAMVGAIDDEWAPVFARKATDQDETRCAVWTAAGMPIAKVLCDMFGALRQGRSRRKGWMTALLRSFPQGDGEDGGRVG